MSLAVELPAPVADRVEQIEEENPQVIEFALKAAALRGHIFDVLTRGFDPEGNKKLDVILQHV